MHDKEKQSLPMAWARIIAGTNRDENKFEEFDYEGAHVIIAQLAFHGGKNSPQTEWWALCWVATIDGQEYGFTKTYRRIPDSQNWYQARQQAKELIRNKQ